MKAWLPFLLSAAVFTSACSDDDIVNPSNTLGVSLGQTASAVVVGGNTTVPITLTRGGGFSGSVNLSAENLPTGVTATFTPATVDGASTSSVLTLTAASTAAAATSTITVRATGNNVTAGTATLPLTVSSNGLTLSASATTAMAAQGAATTIPVVINRIGTFTGDVTLSAENLPTGVTAAFSPATITGTNRVTTLTLTAASTATAGLSTITIRGAGTGVGAQTQTIAFTVSPSATAGFGLSMSPAALSVQAGQSVASAITIARQNVFAGSVQLAAASVPTGMTVTFTPNPAPGTSVAVTVATTSATAAGVYVIPITGTSTGAANYVSTLTVIVSAP
ncbi:hypothetical protein [Gemmatimonas groenlandica]|uniref:Uncharacterized protein n=1 Tax=Gemmatimonas groenlandica TaxID=2732249 RepID=A0A6M4IKK9_9BACT|nr:hypothetical protein [Gemmatimonas groenlandica]QJR34399.1 hypothetical protein HKW67_02110 [Gemmatimonas groenlandica]